MKGRQPPMLVTFYSKAAASQSGAWGSQSGVCSNQSGGGGVNIMKIQTKNNCKA